MGEINITNDEVLFQAFCAVLHEDLVAKEVLTLAKKASLETAPPATLLAHISDETLKINFATALGYHALTEACFIFSQMTQIKAKTSEGFFNLLDLKFIEYLKTYYRLNDEMAITLVITATELTVSADKINETINKLAFELPVAPIMRQGIYCACIFFMMLRQLFERKLNVKV